MHDHIFVAQSPLGKQVVLASSTWNNHIVTRHPEMAGNESAVKDTIENPEVIYRSNWNPDAEIFMSKQKASSYPHLFTRVVVGYNGNDIGNVETALFTKSISV